MSEFMERAGRAVARLIRPAYTKGSRAVGQAVEQAPYHVKYNSAVLLTAFYLIALWGFHVMGMAWLITHFVDMNIWLVAGLYFPVFAFLNGYAEQQEKLPELRRLLGLRLLRKH